VAILVDEALEFLHYVSIFWSYSFNSTYRREINEEWRDGSWVDRFFLLLQGTISILCGVFFPLYLVWWLLNV